jgi:hypothetical protein
MSRFALPALLLPLATFAASPVHAQQWQKYRLDGAAYRIEFPGSPVQDTRDVTTNIGTIRMQTSSVAVGDKTYMMIRSEYPPNVAMSDPETRLDGARNGSVHRTGGVLRSESRTTVGQAPARHLIIDMPQTSQSADAVMILDGRQLLQAIYVGPRGTEETPEARRFLTSFESVQ